MPEYSTEAYVYRLRAGAPMPTMVHGDFVLHTFMAEYTKMDIIACTETLPSSKDFRGQGAEGPKALISASFSRLNVKGGNLFQGKKVYNPDFIEEDELPFNPFPER
jgi:hypothetical protein